MILIWETALEPLIWKKGELFGNFFVSCSLLEVTACFFLLFTIAGLSINGQNMNFGLKKKKLAQIIADCMYFDMVYHTIIWNHVVWHRRVLDMTHFQLFAWFGKYLNNLNSWLCTPLHPKPTLNNQVWSGACPQKKKIKDI